MSVSRVIIARAKNMMAVVVRVLAAVQINTRSERKTKEARKAKISLTCFLDIM